MRRPTLVMLLAILLLALAPMGRAQELAATLSGTVTDSAGALVAHATVTIALNGVAGAKRTVQTDGIGNYVATNLTAGTYTVTTAAPGFETYKATDLILNVAEKHTLNVQLTPGAATTTITVEEFPVQIDTDTGGQAGTISGLQVRELEISDRNFAWLVTLQPGVVNAGMGDEANTESNTGLAVNGARPTANNWTIDGADINDSGSNQTLTNAPSIDAIQEFTLERGSYDAGYGRSGGGQVLVQTKIGTNAFHGDAYEFVRNTSLDANEWFTKRNQLANDEPNKASTYHRNDFGYTIGGPIYIPNHYNSDKKKTFFFWSQEWQKSDIPYADTLPAADANEVAGVIADTPVYAANGTQTGYQQYVPSGSVGSCTITHNAVNHTSTIGPSSCWSRNATVYNTNVFSNHVANAGSDYGFAANGITNFRQEILRVDHYFNDKLHFFARGMEDTMPSLVPGGLWGGASAPNNYPGLSDATVNTPGKNVVGNLTWTATPHIVNEFEFVFAQGTIQGTPVPGQFFNSSAVASALTGASTWAYPDPYGRNPGVDIVGVAQYQVPASPYSERNLDRTYFDNLTITRGRHTVRAGFQFQQMIKTENGTNGAPGFTFNNTNAGPVIAFTAGPNAGLNAPAWTPDVSWSYGDFLLGNVNAFSQVNKDTIPDLRFVNAELYLQDDWKVNRKLTVNMGVRWSRFPSPSDANGTLVNFDPLVFNPANAPAITRVGGNYASGNPNTYGNGIIAPKGGTCEAAQFVAPLSTCSPYLSQVNPTYNTNFAPRVGFAYNPDGRGKTSIRGGLGIFYDRVLDGIWEDNAFDDQPLVQTTTIHNGPFDDIKTGGAAAPGKSPNGMIAVGTPAFKTPKYANYNLSVQRQLLPTTTIEVAYVGNVARHLIGQIDLNQPTVGAREAANAVNIETDVNYIRPYQGFGHIEAVAAIYTNSYNSLQVSANHKAHGLTLQAAYTWSKDLTTMAADRQCCETSDTYNVRMDYGPPTTNTPQVAEISYVYDLPFFKQQHGVEGKVLGGWEFSGITSFISGSSFQVNQTNDPFATNYASTDTYGNPIQVSNNGVGLAQQNGPGWWTSQYTRPNQVAKVRKIKSLNEWFSTSSFATASGNWGTEKNGALLGPGLQRWDMAAIKNLNLSKQVKFQLRGEFFNAFNHENFGGANSANNSDGVDSIITDASFGQVVSGHTPRIIQVAGKIVF